MNYLDRAIGFIAPGVAFKRLQSRARMELMDTQIRKYEGAAEGRRHAGWLSREAPSVNQLIQKDLKNLVVRSRDLSINDPYASSAPQKIANNVVGTGIVPTHKFINTDPLKPSAIKADQALAVVKAFWTYWAESTKCDHDGNFNFYGIQHLVMRTMVVSGECLIIKRPVKNDVNKLGLQLQVLETDFIDANKHNESEAGGGFTFYGIKFDSNNKRAGYWIYDRHPSEGNAKSSFIKIDDIIHVYDPKRAGQVRGVPLNASTLLKQRDLNDYEDAELMGKKSSACFAGFVQNNSVESKSEMFDTIDSIEPGTMQYLNPGETVQFNTPPQNPGYNDYTRTQHRAIANGYHMTYEQYTGDLSNVNFSSGRMGWIESYKQIEYWQYMIIVPNLCDKLYKWFVEKVVLFANVPDSVEIVASWSAPRRAMIDPEKELKAMKDEARSGFSSWSEIVRQQGNNPDEVLEQLRIDQEKFIKAGLMPESNPYFEAMAKLAQVTANSGKDNNTTDK